MDAQTLGTTLVGILVVVSVVLQGLSAQSRRQRAAAKRETARMMSALEVADRREAAALTWGNMALDRIFESVTQRQQHNACRHATDGEAIEIPEVPAELTGGIRAYLNAHAPQPKDMSDE